MLTEAENNKSYWIGTLEIYVHTDLENGEMYIQT
jgi:hypothetical protein